MGSVRSKLHVGRLVQQSQESMSRAKQQERVAQDRCPGIVQASDGCAVVTLTGIEVEVMMLALVQVEVGGKWDREVPAMEGHS